jgi:hypothetical protein
MASGEDDDEEPSSTTDVNPAPSLSSLVGRIQRDRDSSDEGSEGGSTAADSNDDSDSTDSDAHDDSGFFFPGASSEKSGTDGEARSPAEQAETSALSRDGTAAPEGDYGREVGRVEKAAGNPVSSAKMEAIIELVGDVSNLLLLGPLLDPTGHRFCTDILVPGKEVPEHLLLVTFDQSPDERLDALRGHLDTFPDDIAIVNVGDATRSSSPGPGTPLTGSDGIRVSNVPNPTDIQRIGLTINKILSEWEDEGDVVLCFHSLTGLLRVVGPETVFRFLNVLLGRVRSGDIRAHYHVDPDEHDDQTLETYRSLFDEVLRFEADGTVEIDR